MVDGFFQHFFNAGRLKAYILISHLSGIQLSINMNSIKTKNEWASIERQLRFWDQPPPSENSFPDEAIKRLMGWMIWTTRLGICGTEKNQCREHPSPAILGCWAQKTEMLFEDIFRSVSILCFLPFCNAFNEKSRTASGNPLGNWFIFRERIM